jgi:hypothetical protein
MNFDMALLKHFKIRESGVLEFRAEAFNILQSHAVPHLRSRQPGQHWQ